MFGFNKADMSITYYLFKMIIRDKYLGTKFGIIWGVIGPLLLLGVYIFVFGFVLKSKIPGSEKSLDFVIWLISGFVPWLAISEAITASASSVISGIALVKNIVFKTELLTIASVFTGLLPFGVGIIVLVVLLIVSGHGFSWSILWLIFVLPLHFFFLVSIGLFLAATTVFIRDISQVLTSILMLFLFFTPIFYTIEMMPQLIQSVTFYNPFYHIVQFYRDILVSGTSPNLSGVVYMFVLSSVLFVFGLKYFRKLKGYFVSVL